MAENLNFVYNEGTAKSFCYDNSADSCAKYGRLYMWSAAMDSAAVFSDDGKGCGDGVECDPEGDIRGICPEGWHLPSDAEWETLFSAVGGKSIAGTMLKSSSGWSYYKGASGNGSDAYGFSALPAGYYDGNFEKAGEYAYFWLSSEYGGTYAFRMYLYYSSEYARLYCCHSKKDAFSVRCLKD